MYIYIYFNGKINTYKKKVNGKINIIDGQF